MRSVFIRSFAATAAVLTSTAATVTAQEVAWDNPEIRDHIAAMAAHHLCSGMFVVGRDYQRTPQRVFEEDIEQFPQYFAWQDDMEWSVDLEEKTASVWGSGFETRRAEYNGDQGCTILPLGMDGVAFTPTRVERNIPDPTTTPWPTGDVGAYASFDEVDPIKLAAAFEWMMDQTENNTRAVVVAYRGKIIGERYAPGWTKNTPQISWSQGKSIASALTGILVQQGEFGLDDKAPVPEWHGEGDPRNAIKVKHLLRMSSGLDFINNSIGRPESWFNTNEHFRIYFDGINVFEHAIDQPMDQEPDAEFRYRNSDPLSLSRIARTTVEGRGDDWLTFPQRALFDRIGARNYLLEPDAWGNFIISGYDYGSAHDWLRFGLLHLWDGVWEGERILPEGWVEFISSPAPGARNQEYGGLFWLNLNDSYDRLPADAYSARGFMGQTTMIMPSRDMVVVRLGPSPGNAPRYFNEFVGRVLDAIEQPVP